MQGLPELVQVVRSPLAPREATVSGLAAQVEARAAVPPVPRILLRLIMLDLHPARGAQLFLPAPALVSCANGAVQPPFKGGGVAGWAFRRSSSRWPSRARSHT